MRLSQTIMRGYLGLTASFVVAIFGLAGSANAAQATLTGRVYNLSTGQGYAGVTLALCGAGSAVTDANGNWTVYVTSGAYYCARVTGGVPAGLSGPQTRNNPEIGAATTYENQIADVDAYHNPAYSAVFQRWDRSIDGGLDFAYTKVVATPKPVATPIPAPVTTITPSPTPTPSVTPSPSPSPTPTTTPSPSLAVAAASQTPAAPAHPWFRISGNELVNITAIVAVVIMVGLAIVVIPLRAIRRRQYQEYLRSKYYDL